MEQAPLPRDGALARLAFRVSVVTAALTAITFALAVSTPPLSGSLCAGECIGYPYLDIVDRFPRDYLWMFPATVLAVVYVAFVVVLHAWAPPERRVHATFALVLAAMAATVIAGDYFVQLAVVQPSLLAGETGGLPLLTQYNPHGLFIALEELGYLLWAASFLALTPMVGGRGLERAVRWIWAAGAFVVLAGLVAFGLTLGHARGYLFEVMAISVDWLVLLVTSALMAIVFRRASRPA